MTMTIPTVPSLPAGSIAQLADLQNLASACTFLLGKPVARVRDTIGGAAIGVSPGAVSFDTADVNTDGMWSAGAPSRLTIQTPGWYKLRYGVNPGTAGGVYVSYATSTTGLNNPAGAGVTSSPAWSGYTDTATGTFGWCRSAGIWPAYLYAGDYLQVLVQAAAVGSSTGTGSPAGSSAGGSYLSLEYVSIT